MKLSKTAVAIFLMAISNLFAQDRVWVDYDTFGDSDIDADKWNTTEMAFGTVDTLGGSLRLVCPAPVPNDPDAPVTLAVLSVETVNEAYYGIEFDLNYEELVSWTNQGSGEIRVFARAPSNPYPFAIEGYRLNTLHNERMNYCEYVYNGDADSDITVAQFLMPPDRFDFSVTRHIKMWCTTDEVFHVEIDGVSYQSAADLTGTVVPMIFSLQMTTQLGLAAMSIDNVRVYVDKPNILLDQVAVDVDENGTSILNVSLDKKPFADMNVAIVKTGDTAVGIDTSSLTFTPANWNVQQQVEITAANDFDGDNTSASLAMTLTDSLTGTDMDSRDVPVTVEDDEVYVTIGCGSNGVIAGATSGLRTKGMVYGFGVEADDGYHIKNITGDMDVVTSITGDSDAKTVSFVTDRAVSFYATFERDAVPPISVTGGATSSSDDGGCSAGMAGNPAILALLMVFFAMARGYSKR